MDRSPDIESQSDSATGPSQTGRSMAESKFRISTFKPDSRTISDTILGLSDGLTVPFALSAGLSSFGQTRIVILGGLAELVAGAISMGLGGFLGARSEMDSYGVTVRNTREEVETSPEKTSRMVFDAFHDYGLASPTIMSINQHLQSSPDRLHGFLMDFHHRETKPLISRAYKTAIALALSYFFGGLIPLIPYFIVAEDAVLTALWWSVGVMGITLLVFGYAKTCIVVGWVGRKNVLRGVKGGLQMLLVGAAAAGAAIGLVKAIEHGGVL